jgi:sugar lactone lactonase YvrE
MVLAPPSLGAVARTSQIGALISPATSAVIINGLIPPPPPRFIDVWLNKAGLVSTLATFNQPRGLAALPNGNIVVADVSNHRIRLVTPAGVMTILVGGGADGITSGSADGTGTNATFSSPNGVAVLPNGNVVVGDSGNKLIRLVTPAGVVTTLAGGGSAGGTASGSADGTGTSATFSYPDGVAVLPNGNIVVIDTNNHRIRLITPAGVVTTLAGGGASGILSGSVDGIGTNATFSYPGGVAVLPNGNVVVTDSSSHRIRLITPAGVVTTLAGGASGSADGIGTNATFSSPIGVAVLPNGNLVVTDIGNNRIRLITPAGVVTTLAGGGSVGGTAFGSADGIGTSGTFRLPWGVAVLPNGNIVVSDRNNSLIRLITPT